MITLLFKNFSYCYDNNIDSKKIARTVAYTLPVYHLNRLPLNEFISTNAFNLFLDTLDPSKSFFLKSDIDELSIKYPSLHRDLRKGDISFSKDAYDILIKRIKNRNEYIELLLENEFDTQIDEDYLWDREDASWAENEDDWNSLWRKKIKNEYIAKLVDDYTEPLMTNSLSSTTNDLVTADDIDEILSPEDFILKKYKQLLSTMESFDNEMLLKQYLSSFSRVYDPHSDYLSPSNVEDFDINMKLSLVGIGAMLSVDDGAAKIERLISGGPAEKDGRLKPGDKIIAVAQGDSEPQNILHWPLYKAVRLIRGEKGSKVVLTVIPKTDQNGTRTKTIDLIRDEVKLEEQAAKSSIHQIDGEEEKKISIGVITLPDFYADFQATNAKEKDARRCSTDVKNLLKTLQNNNIDGLILDLRNNGGGSLIEAVKIAGYFIPSGPIVQVKNRRSLQILPDVDPITEYDGPLIILVNRLSASASEILAAAMQDYERAIIVGDEHTHGKGTVQTLMALGDKKGSLKLTTSSYYRINGGSTQLKGVTPDIIIPSLFDVADTGEKELDYALPWDTIQPALFTRFDNYEDLIPQLKTASIERREKDEEFQSFLDKRNKLEDKFNSKLISLNLKNRLAEAKNEKELDDIFDDDYNEKNPQTNSLVKIKGLTESDLMLNETLLILKDWLEINDSKTIISQY